ncbi:MAG: hypothetical protein KatS3mg015_0307 [Fimbriimonadales bacterium]|nr:MAG: hypothetical protein KatS3mg015_0307 [Fimbriimonadales bacterium]
MRQDNRRGGGHGGHRGEDRSRQIREIIEKSAEFIRKGEKPDWQFLVDWPKALAPALGDSRTALRRLYDHVAGIRLRMQMDPNADAIREGLPKLQRFAIYQSNRQTIKRGTADWIDAHCRAVNDDPQKFRLFYEFFQSVMAYLPR